MDAVTGPVKELLNDTVTDAVLLEPLKIVRLVGEAACAVKAVTTATE